MIIANRMICAFDCMLFYTSIFVFLQVFAVKQDYLTEFTEPECSFFSPHKAHLPQLKGKRRELLASPEVWIEEMIETFDYLDGIVVSSQSKRERAVAAYLDFISNLVTGLSFGDSEKAIPYQDLGGENTTLSTIPLEREKRLDGLDWPYLAVSMAGLARLRNIQQLLGDVLEKKVPGSLLEAGVWRGGASILMQAVLMANGIHSKAVIVADSFHGLPEGDANLHKYDVGWEKLSYLQVSDKRVSIHFHRLNLLQRNVYFLKGYFNNSMPAFRKYLKIKSNSFKALGYENGLAILRMDGDMYQSTVDILYNCYAYLNIEGYVIVDDWTGFPAKDAILDFFQVHQMSPKVIPIDKNSVYWKKTENVKIQYWRYETKNYKGDP